MTTQRLALGAIAAGAVVIALVYATAFLPGGAPSWAPWPYMVAMSVMLVAAMALGAARPGRGIGRLALPFAATFAILVGCFGAALLLPPPTADSPLWLGLPAGAALVLYGVGLLPVLVLPVAYAVTFEEQTLAPEDLARVRAAAAALRADADRSATAGAASATSRAPEAA